MENKQTSIEWLQECMSIHLTHEQKMQFEGLFQQALNMHKEEIEDAWYADDEYGNFHFFEDYYQKTYGKETDRS